MRPTVLLLQSDRGARLVLEPGGLVACISPRGRRIPIDGGTEAQVSIAAVFLRVSPGQLQRLTALASAVWS